MEASTIYPASFGEILQGNILGQDLLLSCPVNIYTRVRIFEGNKVKENRASMKSEIFMKNIISKWGYKEHLDTLHLDIRSEIPTGKGLASSTADLCAVYYSLLKLFKKPFHEQELIENCIKIEPTDSIIFKQLTLFDYKKGLINKPLGEYFTFYILAFEGHEAVDTVKFNSKQLPALSSVDDLTENLYEAIVKKDVGELSLISTESIIRNEKRLKYDYLKKIIELKTYVSGKGIIGAHSGNVLGIIFEEELSMESALKKLSKDKIKGLKVYPIKTLDKLPDNLS